MEVSHETNQPKHSIKSGAFNRTVEQTDALMLNEWINNNQVFLVDVRETNDFESSRIPGAFLVPMSRFDSATFPRAKGLKTVLVCQSGRRAYALGDQLVGAGFEDVYFLDGGIDAWLSAGFETEE